jgi:hypothetical protein
VNGAIETGKGSQYFDGWRWWTIEELRAFDGILAPRRLAELLAPLLDDQLPDELIETGE